MRALPHRRPAAARQQRREAVSGEQHNDHCRLRFMDQDWWIEEVEPTRMWLANEESFCELDTRKVDWGAYVAEASKRMGRQTKEKEDVN
jgi:hypothetical protein